MVKYRKWLFAVHTVVALLFGLPLFITPRNTLNFFDWTPQDPIMSRLLGVALIALAVASARSFKSGDKSLTKTVLEMDLTFCVLGAIGFARYAFFSSRSYPFIFWFLFGLLIVFSIAWAIAYFKD